MKERRKKKTTKQTWYSKEICVCVWTHRTTPCTSSIIVQTFFHKENRVFEYKTTASIWRYKLSDPSIQAWSCQASCVQIRIESHTLTGTIIVVIVRKGFANRTLRELFSALKNGTTTTLNAEQRIKYRFLMFVIDYRSPRNLKKCNFPTPS